VQLPNGLNTNNRERYITEWQSLRSLIRAAMEEEALTVIHQLHAEKLITTRAMYSLIAEFTSGHNIHD
jgi:hypothetical protein